MKKSIKKFFSMTSLLLILTIILAACGSRSDSASTPSETGNESTGSESTENGSKWPQKAIELVVPYAAGGDTDFHARTYAKYLEKELGQPVVVVNVEGANGTVGALKVKDAKPDGYTALWFHESMLVNNVIETSDFTHQDFETVSVGVYDDTYVLAVHKDAPYANLGEMVEAAKKKPGELTYGTQIGGFTYYMGALLEEESGASFNIVDPGGAPARNTALLSKSLDINAGPYGSMKSYFDSGDFRALAVMSEKRSELFPDVPTAIEQGFDVSVKRAYFMLMPKGTDAEIVKKMSEAMGKINQMPEYAEDIEKSYSVTPGYSNTEESKKYLDDALERYIERKDLLMGN